MKFELVSLVAIITVFFSEQKSVSASELPQLNLALNMNAVNLLKNYYGPILEQQYIHNNTDLNVNITQKLKFLFFFKAKIEVNSVVLKDIVINWNKITIFPGATNQLSARASNLSLTLSAHFKFRFGLIRLNQNISIALTDISLSSLIDFTNDINKYPLGFLAQISKLDLTYAKLQITLKSQILTFLVRRVQWIVKQIIPKALKKVKDQVNDQLKTLSAAPIVQTFALSSTNFTATVNFPQGINVIAGKASELIIPVNIANIQNDFTGAVVPQFLEVPLPGQFFNGAQDLEAIVGENVVEQIMWTAFQSGIVDFWINNDALMNATNGSLPISLNTSSIGILFPGITIKYGANRGMYINITIGSTYPNFYIRSGRLSGSISLLLTFIVDMTNNYPQPADNCINCQSAITINTTLFIAADAWTFLNTTANNTQYLGIQIIDVALISAPSVGRPNVVYSETVFSQIVNNLILLTVPTINPQLNNGFPVPKIDNFPLVKNVSLILLNDYLVAAAQIAPVPAPAIIN